MTSAGAELVVVANRLPVRQVQDPESETMSWEVSPGGLVAALTPSLAEYRDDCLGRLDRPHRRRTHRAIFPRESRADSCRPVVRGEGSPLRGDVKRTFWPLYHDKVRAPEFHRTWWDGYQRVNERFAQAVSDAAAPGARVWIHDYQLQLVSGILRQSRPDLRIGFFLHIPFPPPELFTQLPWRSHIVEALLGNDVVGFQTPADAENFYRLAVGLDLADSEGKWTLSTKGRSVEVRAFPLVLMKPVWRSNPEKPTCLPPPTSCELSSATHRL